MLHFIYTSFYFIGSLWPLRAIRSPSISPFPWQELVFWGRYYLRVLVLVLDQRLETFLYQIIESNRGGNHLFGARELA